MKGSSRKHSYTTILLASTVSCGVGWHRWRGGRLRTLWSTKRDDISSVHTLHGERLRWAYGQFSSMLYRQNVQAPQQFSAPEPATCAMGAEQARRHPKGLVFIRVH